MNAHPNQLTPEQMRKLQALKEDFTYFSSNILKVENKRGDIVSFKLNIPQEYIHYRAEDMLRRKGFVRILIVKARQQGCSTYVGGRFVHKARYNSNRKIFVFAHDAKTTARLFGGAKLFFNNMPEAVSLKTETENTKELTFINGTTYYVGTAGSKNVGRGFTCQLFHGSEVAFWDNSEQIMAGIMQSVPMGENSEIYFESTGNGASGKFYNMVQNASRGVGDFELVFIPWYWQPEYSRTDLPPNFTLTPEEEKVKAQYNLTEGQMFWRRQKIVELGEWLFRQEYPATVEEAFQSSTQGFFEAEDLQKVFDASKRAEIDAMNNNRRVIAGLDMAGETGKDQICFARRQGGYFWPIEKFSKGTKSVSNIVGFLVNEINAGRLYKCFVDNAYGEAVVNRMIELGYGSYIMGIWFSATETVQNREAHLNKRVEMHINLREYCREHPTSFPDDAALKLQMSALPREIFTSGAKKKLLPKEDFAKLIGGSPNELDAMALTVAMPVQDSVELKKTISNNIRQGNQLKVTGGLSTAQRRRGL